MMLESMMFMCCMIVILIVIDIVIRSKLLIAKSPDPLPARAKNKYTEMDYFSFDRLLSWVFAQILEQTAFAYESPNDYKSESDLIAKTVSEFMSYFASSNDAIDAAYGEGFLTKWVVLKLGILGNRKIIKSVIGQGITSDMIYRTLCITEMEFRGRR